MPKTNRDDFTPATIRALELRVGTLCSNPNCRLQTTGPHSQPDKVLRIGVAAHIHAAAPNGPRFDQNMKEGDRSSILNGIWLCENCATLIDKDPDTYTAELLRKWKLDAEQVITESIIQGKKTIAVSPPPHIDVTLRRTFWGRSNYGYSMKNPIEQIDGETVMVIRSNYTPIIHWGLHWNYELSLYNNSRSDIFNAAITFDQQVFSSITQLGKVNNLVALVGLPLTAKIESNIESTYVEADLELQKIYPYHLEGLQMKITYRDGFMKKYEQNFRLENGDFIEV